MGVTALRLGESFRALGVCGALLYKLQALRCRLFRVTHPVRLIAKDAKHPLMLRPGTSDQGVFGQIFIDREYACLEGLPSVGLVIDCGANVGYSAAYLLSRFAGCRVIAIEPDPENYRMLQANVAPYGDRVECKNTAIWSHPTGLKLSEAPYRDGGKWAVQVRECRPGEAADLQAVDIATVLRESGCGRVAILKMDIEGAEAVVFASAYESWLSSVDNLVIELHDDSCFGNASQVFSRAIADQGFEITRLGERTICKRQVSR